MSKRLKKLQRFIRHSKGEIEVRNHFSKKFPNHEWKHTGWLTVGGQRILRDLYSDKLKVCVEYDGIWHFENINGQLKYKRSVDKKLQKWCLKNKYRLIRISESFYKDDIDFSLKLLEHKVYSSNRRLVKLGEEYK